MLLQTKLEDAWKKEDIEALDKDICSADETLAVAISACQLLSISLSDTN